VTVEHTKTPAKGALPLTITYHVNAPVDPRDAAALFHDSGIRRPHDDLPRVTQMVQHANLIVTAWDADQLVGIARALTDWCYCCYLSDVAVAQLYQGSGIGTALLERVRAEIGDSVTLVLVSAPEARPFYQRIGLSPTDQAFIVRRKR
jgi:GNAT superfamily N-acetyltransferase